MVFGWNKTIIVYKFSVSLSCLLIGHFNSESRLSWGSWGPFLSMPIGVSRCPFLQHLVGHMGRKVNRTYSYVVL